MIPLPSLTQDLPALTAALDAASPDARVNWSKGLGKKEQAALWRLAEGKLPLTVEHFIGAPGEILAHEGHNSLFLFTEFQKRILLHNGVPQGYNHQTMSWFTGPGHFTLYTHELEVWFDYTKEPKDAPATFPAVAPNMSGFSRFVYGGMIDRVRKVSQHVVIGKAWRAGKETENYFLLVKPA